MKKLSGIIPYLISPIGSDGVVKQDVLHALSCSLIDDGVHGLCVLGSVGEFPYLSASQKDDMVRTVVRASSGRVPVVAGISGYSVAQLCDEAHRFVLMGVDALVVMVETYFPLDGDQLAQMYRTVAQRVPSCPIVIYSNPKYMHYELALSVFDKLIDVPNILYFKDASGNTGKLLSFVNRFGDRFKLFSASAHIPLFVSQLGGIGWMAGPACLIPRQSVRLFELIERQDIGQAMILQRHMWEINRVFSSYDLASCVKAGLEHLGFDVGDPLPPLRRLSETGRREVFSIIDQLRQL